MSRPTGHTTIDVYRFIVDWALKHKGNTPSQREIGRACDISGSTAQYHTELLVGKKLLARIDGELCVMRSDFMLHSDAYNLDFSDPEEDKIAEMKIIPKDIRGLR